MDHTSENRLNEYAAQAKPADIEKIRSHLDGMNRGQIMRLWDKVRSLWSLILDPKGAWATRAIAIGALLYLVSPFDAIPDLIPFLGLSDDAGVVLAAAAALAVELAKYQMKPKVLEVR